MVIIEAMSNIVKAANTTGRTAADLNVAVSQRRPTEGILVSELFRWN